jgi:genome maintenance exonuclease 1
MSNEGLVRWKEENGPKLAKYICDSAISRGNKFHKICEAYVNNDCTCKFVNHLLEYGMFKQAQPALERISDIVGIEMPMISRELGIGGTADIIAKFDGVLSVIDLKSSTSPKQESWCEKFFLQETAYSLMFEVISSNIKE